MSLSLVSVVVPCYNVERYAGRAVASALAQTHPPCEVLCIDDGSTDGTLAVLRDLEAAHPERVRVIAQANRGACAARNRGLAEARGTYVQFLDADDVLEPEKVRHQVALAARAGTPDLVVGSYRRLSLSGEGRQVVAEAGDAWSQLVSKTLGITSANLWRAEAVRAAGGWSEAWASSQEYELMFRLLQRGARVAFDKAVLTTLYEREGSISADFTGPVFERYVRLRVEMVEYLRAEGLLVGARRKAVLEKVFLLLRTLYVVDPQAALAYYRRVIPPKYSPPVSKANTRPYVVAHRLLGFAKAERLRTLMRRRGV